LASGNTSFRNVSYTSILGLDDTKIIGKDSEIVSGTLEIIVSADIFKQSFNITFESIDLKLMNADYSDLIVSKWFYYGHDFNETISTYPTYRITIPFHFTPRVLPADTFVSIDVIIRGTYEGFTQGDNYIKQTGTLATLQYTSSIQYIAEGYTPEKSVMLDNQNYLILTISIITFAVIIRMVIRRRGRKTYT